MKTSSAKAKGRRLQNYLVDSLKSLFGLPDDDVRGAIMGENGTDVKLSTKALDILPFSFECKNTEKLNIWAAIKQSVNNMIPNTIPVVVFKRNRSEVFALLPLDGLLRIVQECNMNNIVLRDILLRGNNTDENTNSKCQAL